jgi:tetratricopeptide (TPR) repeat protein
MYYLLRKEYNLAVPYLEKGLEYNPNSTQIIGLLADFYSNYLPNTGKYLEYALKGLQLDANSGDSVSISYFHLRLANALIQTGFVDESLKRFCSIRTGICGVRQKRKSARNQTTLIN